MTARTALSQGQSLQDTDDILSSFDQYHSLILQQISSYKTLEQNNFSLLSDNQQLLNENKQLQQLLIDQDRELEEISKKILPLLQTISKKYETLSIQIDQQKTILKLKYDNDILLTSNRNLEKDLMLQRIENERLRNTNNQLLRELKSTTQGG